MVTVNSQSLLLTPQKSIFYSLPNLCKSMRVSASHSLSEVQASGGPVISLLRILEYEDFMVIKAEPESAVEPCARN